MNNERFSQSFISEMLEYSSTPVRVIVDRIRNIFLAQLESKWGCECSLIPDERVMSYTVHIHCPTLLREGILSQLNNILRDPDTESNYIVGSEPNPINTTVSYDNRVFSGEIPINNRRIEDDVDPPYVDRGYEISGTAGFLSTLSGTDVPEVDLGSGTISMTLVDGVTGVVTELTDYEDEPEHPKPRSNKRRVVVDVK